MKFSFLSIFLFLASVSFSQKKQVCFSIDDLPVVSYGMNDTSFQKGLFNKLIKALNKNNVPAIGFVNEIKLFKNDTLYSFQKSLLESWDKNGLDLGNHTYSHPDYNKVTFEEYTNDILKGESIIKEILTEKGRKMKYFRHPFLHAGNTKAKADSLEEFLLKKGYCVAPVTIDNEDYLFALAYKRTAVKHDSVLMKKIGTDYIDYMEQKLLYFEKQAQRLFGRDINQVLLFHASLLNADYVDALARMYRKHNYEFVNMDKALEDKAYTTKITVFSEWGISWIDRWALSKGKKEDFFKEEPVTPEYIVELAK